MKICDWRQATPADVAVWYAHERQSWRDRFSWDTDHNWHIVEAARQAGTLPGWLAYEGARSSGWTFYLVHRAALQIGALTAASESSTRRLLDAVLRSPEATESDTVMTFVPATTPGLDALLTIAGFDVHRYRYLSLPISSRSRGAASCPTWTTHDVEAVARLLSRAYPGEDQTRPFAPGGSAHEWLEYLERLLVGGGCGLWLPGCSVLTKLPPETCAASGAVVTTSLGGGTAHLAQVAVDPACQGRGLARRMLDDVLASLSGFGYARVTLLVSERNRRAVALYEQRGFQEVGSFLCATRRQPRVSTSAAGEIGGASTRR